MSCTCLEPEGSSSGRQLYVQLWYCTFNMPHNKQCISTEHTLPPTRLLIPMYEGWNFNSGNYLFTTDTK